MATKGSKLLLAGLAGIAAGVALGILFAPARGAKTRKRLKKGLKDLTESEGSDLTEKLKSIFSSRKEEDDDQEETAPGPKNETNE